MQPIVDESKNGALSAALNILLSLEDIVTWFADKEYLEYSDED